MKKNSTQYLHHSAIDKADPVRVSSRSAASPKAMTLTLIRQFARVYTCEPRLHPSIQGMVVN